MGEEAKASQIRKIAILMERADTTARIIENLIGKLRVQQTQLEEVLASNAALANRAESLSRRIQFMEDVEIACTKSFASRLRWLFSGVVDVSPTH